MPAVTALRRVGLAALSCCRHNSTAATQPAFPHAPPLATRANALSHHVDATTTNYYSVELLDAPATTAAGGHPMTGSVQLSLTRARSQPSFDSTLVSIGGTAQLLRWFNAHARTLASTGRRQVIAYEARGQGKTTLSVHDASLAVHSVDFFQLSRSFPTLAEAGAVDLCGFSFGGRVALAIAAEYPHLVRRLVLTGVAGDRRATGRLIVKGWQEALRAGCAKTFVFNSMLETHGPKFLEENEARIPFWANDIARANSVQGLLANITHTHQDDPDHPWSTSSLAHRVRCPVLLIVGSEDRLAPAKEAVALAESCGWQHVVVPETGHSVPLERREEWTQITMDFLDANQ